MEPTMTLNKLYVEEMDSPVGPLLITLDAENTLVGLYFLNKESTAERIELLSREDVEVQPAGERSEPVRRQLEEYFRGERREFDLPLKPQGTPFEQGVWRELQNIPYGHTVSYGEVSRRLDNPKAVRAVGRANGANPIPIIVPCHRVIGANGKLTGFGGGLPAKAFLLRLEGALPHELFPDEAIQ